MTHSPRRRRRSLLAGLVAVILASVTACSGETSTFGGTFGGSGGQGGGDDSGGKSISMSVVAGWDDAIAASYLWKELLEQQGYQVNLQELDIARTFTGVANGQIDVYLDAWLPVTHGAYWNRFQNQLEIVSDWTTGQNLLAVPDYVAVDSIADLEGRTAEFDGRIVGIEAGPDSCARPATRRCRCTASTTTRWSKAARRPCSQR